MRVDVINVAKASFILLALDLVNGPEMLCSGYKIGLEEPEFGSDDDDGTEADMVVAKSPLFSLFLPYSKGLVLESKSSNSKCERSATLNVALTP